MSESAMSPARFWARAESASTRITGRISLWIAIGARTALSAKLSCRSSQTGPSALRWLFPIITPKPAQRIRKDCAAMFSIVTAIAKLEFVIVAGEFQRGGHFLVRQRPIAMEVIEVIRSILEKNADWFLFRSPNERG